MATTPINLNTSQTFVTELAIERLYDLYSYNLSIENSKDIDLSRLLILYGDNGSGKTTILKLLFNILSPVEGRGHRTFIAQTPFHRFSVKIGDDTRVSVQKLKQSLTGSFRATITRNNIKVFDEIIKVSRNVKGEEVVARDETNSIKFGQVLADLNITLYFLSDDRRTQSTIITPDEEAHLLIHQEDDVYVTREGKIHRRKAPNSSEQNLEIAIRRLEDWIKTEALKGSNVGEANTNTIYTDIVRRIARARGKKQGETTKTIEELRADLFQLDKRSKEFSKYGLITSLQVNNLISASEVAIGTRKQIIANVLTPYIDGLRARLSALQEVQNLIELFLGSVNSFFHNKSIAYDTYEGIQISSFNGDRLTPKMLSSGERQLLLLFCNTITARNQASIFIIDEPEISLNVKWQRKLLQVLLDITKDSAVQFIIATHSVELLTRHKSHVLRLTNTNLAPHSSAHG